MICLLPKAARHSVHSRFLVPKAVRHSVHSRFVVPKAARHAGRRRLILIKSSKTFRPKQIYCNHVQLDIIYPLQVHVFFSFSALKMFVYNSLFLLFCSDSKRAETRRQNNDYCMSFFFIVIKYF